MLKSIGKRYLSLLLALLMVVSLLPTMTASAEEYLDVDGFGAYINYPNNEYYNQFVTWTVQSRNSISGVVSGANSHDGGCGGTSYDAKALTSSIELTNESDVDALLVFSYTVTAITSSQGYVKVDGTSVASGATGSVTKALAPNENVLVELASGESGSSKITSVLIDNIQLIPIRTVAQRPEKTAEQEYVYSLATPVFNEDGWTTEDDYSDLFYYAYDSATGEGDYYPVVSYKGAVTPMAPAGSLTVDELEQRFESGELYYYYNGEQCRVRPTRGTLYQRSSTQLDKNLIPTSFDVGDNWFTTYHFENFYSVTDFYVYDETNDAMRHMIVATNGEAGYYKAWFYYLTNEDGLDMSYGYHDKDGNNASDYWGDSRGHTCITFSGGEYSGLEELHYHRSILTIGIGNVSEDSTHYGLKPDCPVYTKLGDDMINGFEVLDSNGNVVDFWKTYTKTEEFNSENLYYKTNSGGIGTVELDWLNDKGDNAETRFSTTARGDSVTTGQVIYTGPLYRCSSGVNGAFDGQKTLSDRNSDGTFDLTIDSWSTGNYYGMTEAVIPGTEPGQTVVPTTTTTTVTRKQPLDIVLVLDQSGSMAATDIAVDRHPEGTGKTEYTLSELNGDTYFYQGEDGEYYRVQMRTGQMFSESTSKVASWMFGYGHDGISLAINGAPVYYNVPTNHYIKDSNGVMHRIFMVTAGLDLYYGLYPYVYTDANDAYTNKKQWTDNHYWVIIFSPWTAKKLRNNDTWNTLTANGAEDSQISFINQNGQMIGSTDADGNSAELSYSWITNSGRIRNVYKLSGTGYTELYYVDSNGVEHTITTHPRYTAKDKFVTDAQLYTMSSTTSRREALKTAVEKFVTKVQQNQPDGVTHRIAMVGFAGNQIPGFGGTLNDGSKRLALGSNGKFDFANTGLFDVSKSSTTFKNYWTLADELESAEGNQFVNHHYYTSDTVSDPVVYDGESWEHVFPDQTGTINPNSFYEPTYSSKLGAAEYASALVNADSVTVPQFGAYGGTYTSYGIAMANQIFANNEPRPGTETTTTTVTNKQTGEVISSKSVDSALPAKRVIVVFTDGEPGASGFETAIANEALAGAAQSKDEQNATIYTVGLYPGKANSQVQEFMKELSSEYTARLEEVYSVSNNGADTKLNGNATYYYERDGKIYSVAAREFGESSLGWWAEKDGVYIHLDPMGKNAFSGEDRVYNANGSQVYGEDMDQHSTYYYRVNGQYWEVTYKYLWFDADNRIVTPKTSDTDPNGTQFYRIADQVRNEDGGNYFFTATNANELNVIFSDISSQIVSMEDSGVSDEPKVTENSGYVYGPEAISYSNSETVVRDVISNEFIVPANPTITLEMVKAVMDAKGNVSLDETTTQPVEDDVEYQWNPGNKTLSITGYDFAANYVNRGHDGWVVRAKISSLQPVPQTGEILSNEKKESGIYEAAEDGDKLFTYNNPSAFLGPYTVTWMNGDHYLDQGEFNYLDDPVYFGSAPVKESADPNKLYTFAGWSETDGGEVIAQLPKVTKDVTYYAVFTEKDLAQTYTVEWYNLNNELIYSDSSYTGADRPAYKEAQDTQGKLIVPDGSYLDGWYTGADRAENQRYFGQKNMADMANADGVVKLYAKAEQNTSYDSATVVVEYGTRNVISAENENVYDYAVAEKKIQKTVGEKQGVDVERMEYAGKFDLQYAKVEGAKAAYGSFGFTPLMDNDSGIVDLTALSNVSKAYYYTDENYKQIHEVTVVPGSSVYFDDSLTSVSASLNADGRTFNYKAALEGENNTAADAETFEKGTTRTFTFSGSRIDVYCTTDDTANTVTAVLNDDTTNTKVKSVVMSNKFENGKTKPFYNTPTLSFTGLDNTHTYTLTIKAATTNYRFDGVRVYQTLSEADEQTYYTTDEQNAQFFKVRDLLLNEQTAFETFTQEGVTGAVFVDNVGLKTGATFDQYKAKGPKNEVYLNTDQGVAFTIPNYQPGMQVQIGLKAQTTGNVKVSAGDSIQPIEVKSATEVYYTITPTDEGHVIIWNAGSDNLISLTNVMISGEASVQPNQAPLMVNRSLQSYVFKAAAMPVVEQTSESSPEPSPDPGTEPSPEPSAEPTTAPSIHSIVQQIISTFVNSLFKSISRLFGN